MVGQASSTPPSVPLQIGCVLITALLCVGLPLARAYAGRRSGESKPESMSAVRNTAIGLGLWLALTGTLAAAGVLADFDDVPPRPMPLLALGVVLTFVAAFSRFGARLATSLPLALIVGYQGFRVAVEIMIHRAYVEGVVGQQMTWSGLNFDVVTGMTALALGVWLWRRNDALPAPRVLLWVWNVLGLALLINIVTIAIMSFPGPLSRFDGPPNLWVTTVPFVWLPMIMVTAALFGHLLLARRLLSDRQLP